MTSWRAVSDADREAMRIALGGLLLLIVGMGVGRFAYTPLLPGLREALDWPLARAGDVASANYFGYVVGALLAATIAFWPAQRRWLIVGLLASAVTTGAGAFTTSGAGWLALRAVSGVASAFVLVLGTAIVTRRLLALGRPGLMAVHFAGVGIGIMLSVLVIELARIAGLSVFGQWAALGLACLAVAGVALVLLRTRCDPPPAGSEAQTSPAASQATAAPSAPHLVPRPARLLRRLVAAYGLFGFGYVVTATFIVEMARALPQARLAEPLAWLAVGLCAVPSTAIWQGLATRLGTWRALRIAFAVEAVGVLLAGYGKGIVTLMLGGGLLGATFVGMTALGLAAGRRIDPQRADRVMGWMTAAFGVGQWIGPIVAGRLAQATGGFGLPSLAAAGMLALGFVLLRVRAEP